MFSFLRTGVALCLLMAALGAFPLQGRAEAASSPSIPVSEEYVLRKWDLDDGLPNNHVSGLAQTPDGYLWVAMGAGGLARFDGVRFVPVTQETHPGLESDHASQLYMARDGALWIGLIRGGIARFQGGQFQTIIPMGPVQGRDYIPVGFAEDGEGGVWICNSLAGKCFRWKQGKLTSFSRAVAGYAQIHADSEGKIWYGNPWGYDVFVGGRFQTVERINQQTFHLAPARAGGMWLFQEQKPEKSQLLFRCHPDGTKQLMADLYAVGGLQASQIQAIYEDKSGALWLGTRSNGLLKYENGRLVRVPTSHSCILKLLEDQEGNLWVGTEGGLNRLCRSGISLHQTRDGLSHDSVVSLTEDTQGRIWVVCRDTAPFRASDSTNRSFVPASDGGTGGAIMTLCSDPSGRVWFGSFVGLGFWKEDAIVRFPLASGFTALLPDRNEGLWAAATLGGLVYLKDGQVKKIPNENGLTLPRALAQDQAGGIWVGAEQGAVFHKSPAPPGKESAPGSGFMPVPLPGARHREQIRFIVPDPIDGSVWIGALGDGLFRWKAGRVTRLSQDSGLPQSDLRLLLISGDFWIGTGRGLLRVDRHALEAAMEGKPGPLQFLTYGRNEGLPSMEFSFGFRSASAQTPDGHLWFATYSGALEVNPQLLTRPSPPGPVLIEALEFGGTSFSAPEALAHRMLPPNPGPVQIRYTLPELRAPEQLHFRYRLLGSSASWISMEGQRVALFEHLVPGHYRFEVSASETGGYWKEPTALEFSVEAAWWETGWFKICAGLLAAAGGSILGRFIVKRRVRARMRRLEQENALERERIRLARDLHDQVGANLTQIALMAAFSSAEEESRKRLSKTAREAVEALNAVVWAVDPGMDSLGSLLQYLAQYSEAFLKDSGVRRRVEIPTTIPERALSPEFRHHFLLIIKEALNNSVKYSGASEIRLSGNWDEEFLTVTVADNGHGFDPQDRAASPNGGRGLANMTKRAAALRGECRIDSSPETGTSITLKAPWPNGMNLPPIQKPN